MTALFILLMCGAAHATSLEIHDGVLVKSTVEECTITSNGRVDNIRAVGRIPGLWYGLLEFKCGQETGTIVSELTCINCGVYCQHNEMIIGCKQYWFPLLMGITISIIPFMVIMVLLRKKIHKLTGWAVMMVVKCHYGRKDAQSSDIRSRIRDATGTLNEPVSVNTRVPFLKQQSRDAVYNSRLIKLNKHSRQPMAEYIELSEAIPSAPVYDVTHETDHKQKSSAVGLDVAGGSQNKTGKALYPDLPKPTKAPSVGVGLSAAAALLLLSNGANACSLVLYAQNDGRICDSRNCEVMPMTSFPMSSGQLICLEDTEGLTSYIRLSKTEVITRYHSMYQTNGYKLYTDQFWECKSPSSLCWNRLCKPNTRHPDFTPVNGTIADGYLCQSDTIGCDTMCWHQTSCVFTHWYIKRNNPYGTVYHKTSSIWEVSVTIEKNNITRTLVMNTNNPSSNMISHIVGQNKGIPAIVSSFSSEQYFDPDGGVLVDGDFHKSQVSSINMPERDKVGDIQTELTGGITIINTDAVKCETRSCETYCTIPEPKIVRLLRSHQSSQTLINDFTTLNDNRVILTRTPVQGTVLLSLGRINVKSVKVEHGVCDIGALSSYACTGCSTDPYVILQATKVAVEGVVEYLSNCSFKTPYLNCNSMAAYKLELSSDDKYCIIYIPSSNTTLSVDFTYAFTGDLDYIRQVASSDTFGSGLKSVVTSENFIDGVTWTLDLGMVLTTVVALATRGAKMIVAYKMNKEIIA